MKYINILTITIATALFSCQKDTIQPNNLRLPINKAKSGGGSTVNLSNGLVAYYPFDGNANDASGNGNNGTVNGATLTKDRKGQINKAYNFNGSTNYIDLTNADFKITGNQERSISIWVNPASLIYRNMNLFATGNPSYAQAFNIRLNTFLPTYTSYRLGFMSFANDFDPFYNTSGGTKIVNQKWYHIVVVYQNNTIHTYVNGKSEASSNLNIDTQGNQNYIGKSNHIGWENYFEGIIDDVRIYNRTLNQSEITFLATQ